MKTACIGNMNNMMFSLIRYLRDRGVDADLLLLEDEQSHFHPSFDTFDLDYQKYTRMVSWGAPHKFCAISPDAIRGDLSDYDILIGSGSAPAFVRRAGRTLNLFIPYGDDIIRYPFFRNYLRTRHLKAYLHFCAAQKRGIQKSTFLNLDMTNPVFEDCLKKLGYGSNRLSLAPPMLYAPVYSPDTIQQFYERSHWHHAFSAIRENNDVLIFHHGRHVWKTYIDEFSSKGNDVLIRGFAAFVQSKPSVKSALVMIEYGPDVEESKRLISSLGIGDRVYWLPRMARKDIMVCLSMADIGTGEFSLSWLSCGTVYEVLSSGKPLMHYRDEGLYGGNRQELYPLINVRSPDDICAALIDYSGRPDFYARMGRDGRDWFLRYGVEVPLEMYMKIINKQSFDLQSLLNRTHSSGRCI